MKAADWIDLVQKFPPSEFDGFGLYLDSGMEVTMQSVLQLNGDHMLIRGRNVGSADAGRFFYIPYDRIICIVYNRPVREEVVLAWYDGAPPMSIPTAAEEPVEEEAPVEEAPVTPAAPAAAGTRTGARPSMPTAIRPALAPKPAAAAPVVRPGATIHPTPTPANQAASGLQQTGNLASAQSNPIKTALLERLRARRQGQDPPSPEKK
jgi:hypothetical protein